MSTKPLRHICLQPYTFTPRVSYGCQEVLMNQKSPYSAMAIGALMIGGERGIRTLDTLLTYTPLAGARLQPLGHFSVKL